MGMGSIPIGVNTSPVYAKLISLQGNGNTHLVPSQPVCLPDTVVEPKTVAVMTVAQLSTSIISKGAGYSYPLLAQNAVNMPGGIMQISPIPPYFVYDGFEIYLDAALVLERVMSVNPSVNNMFNHLKLFLSMWLSAHNAGDCKPYLVGTELSAAPSMPARRWAKENFARCFPTLATPGGPVATGGATPQGPDLEALINTISGANTTSSNNILAKTSASTKK